MVAEQIQNYVNLVGGVSRATKAKASEAAKGLLSAAGLDDVAADANERVTHLAEDIIAASRANREVLVKTITAEVDKAAARLGFARADDLDTLRNEVAELRAALAEQSGRAAAAEAAASEATATAAAATAAAAAAATTATTAPRAKAPAARKAAAKKAPAKAAETRGATKKTAARKSTAKKTPANRSTTKKTAAKQAPVAPAETA